MKGNARKYLSLMLTASMVLGSFGTTAIAATSTTTGYISLADIKSTGATTPSALSATSSSATITNAPIVKIQNESTHTVIDVGSSESDLIRTAYTTNAATANNSNATWASIDFVGKDITVKSNSTALTMSGGTIGTLKFEAPTRSARAAVAGNKVTVSGGQTTGDIMGAEEVTVAGGTVANINDAKNVTVTSGTVGAVAASDAVTISNGTVNGTVSAKTATISGGTVNSTVTATDKVEISGANTTVKAVESKEVAVTGGTVTATITGANITVAKGATVKDIVVNDKNAVVKVEGTLASGATITVDPSIAKDIESLEVTVPAGSTVTVPKEATKVEKVDGTGEVTSFQVSVNYYEKKSSTTATKESGLITGSIATDKTKSIKLATTLDDTAFTGDWHSNLTNKDGSAVTSTATKAGDSFVVLDTYATPLNFYSVDDSGTPSTVSVKFEYYNGTTTTSSAITVPLTKDANGDVHFPDYTDAALNQKAGTLKTPDNQEFDGWGIGDKTTIVIGRKDDVITNVTATYVPVFKAKGTNSDKIKVELYRINSDTTAQKTVELDFTLVNGNKVFKAPANEFSYSGKTFDSWSTNFDKAYYYPGKDVTVPAGTPEPVKLYAYWTNKSSSGGGGGGGSSSSSTKYTVTASAGKGGSISPSGDVQVTKGNDKTFKITADKGYVISDVLVDGDSVGAVKTYTIKNIKNDMTIKAVFETEDGKPAEDPENPSENPSENKGTFTDTRGHWAEKYINTVVEKGLFSGMTDTTFGPDVAMTRAMFVTVLGRMSNVNTTSYSSSKFSDVPADSWFGPYVNWAAQQGIVSGLTSTTFGPNDPITREQMAVILVNYAKVAGVVLPTVNDPMMFSDNSNISGWAKDAVATAQKAGLINGRTNGSFDPQGKATRAEVATVFVQLDSLTGGSKAAATDTAAGETETTETEETTEE